MIWELLALPMVTFLEYFYDLLKGGPAVGSGVRRGGAGDGASVDAS